METPKKKPKRFRLLRCFKPDDVAPSPRGVDPIFTYIAVPEKHHYRFHLPAAFSSVFRTTKNVAVKTDNSMSGRKKVGKENSNSIRKALVSALNHTSLAKKLNYKRKTKKDGFSSESASKLSSNTATSTSPSSQFTPFSLSASTKSSTTSTSTQASGSSSESYLSRSLNGSGLGKQKLNIGDSRKGYLGSNMPETLLFITSLMVLILLGKCCAIAYTTIGFFVISNRTKRPCNEGNSGEELSSVRYKK
ncbi:uncharacterized protein LOC114917112 [Cajanus cajan]|uniref:uncharacterized protein LOC114917112 n=1 Tax=Cajanus cajan TaxID=3821 RepID=UPI0010FBA4FB|nr:uncharacterized protein LOC114917112 [Cajanus cajan]